MFLVKKKPLTPNTVWDGDNGKVLCKFEKGIFRTEDQAVADKLLALGYEVTSEDGEPYTGNKADPPQEGSESNPPQESSESNPPQEGSKGNPLKNNTGKDESGGGKTDPENKPHGSGKKEK